MDYEEIKEVKHQCEHEWEYKESLVVSKEGIFAVFVCNKCQAVKKQEAYDSDAFD